MSDDGFFITYEGNDYKWSPSKSTPSAKNPIAELSQIIHRLQESDATSVVDFGAGRGRNMQLLADAFDRLILVEDSANVPRLEELVEASSTTNCKVLSWDEYKRHKSPKVHAILICFVIHTLPSPHMRMEVVHTNLTRLRQNGILVFVTPRNDPKYKADFLVDAVEFGDGIVRLYHHQKTFSFYRNYTDDQFRAFLTDAKLTVEDTIRSDRRMIFLTRRA